MVTICNEQLHHPRPRQERVPWIFEEAHGTHKHRQLYKNSHEARVNKILLITKWDPLSLKRSKRRSVKDPTLSPGKYSGIQSKGLWCTPQTDVSWFIFIQLEIVNPFLWAMPVCKTRTQLGDVYRNKTRSRLGRGRAAGGGGGAVSYTHLTLPTRRWV